MLHIVARGSTRQAAESLAQAVAEAELAYEQEASSSLSQAEGAALDERQSQLASQLAAVNREIERTKTLLSSSNTEVTTGSGRTDSALSADC